jgi:RNA-directed DNA polymerase
MANIYLNSLDHYCKDYLAIKFYLRYVDDIVIMSDSKSQLHEWKFLIEQFCLKKLALTIHPYKINIFPKSQGLDFLGYRIYPHKKLIRKSIQKNLRKAIELRVTTAHRRLHSKNLKPQTKSGALHHCPRCTKRRGVRASRRLVSWV